MMIEMSVLRKRRGRRGEVEKVGVKRCLMRRNVTKCDEHSQITNSYRIDIGN